MAPRKWGTPPYTFPLIVIYDGAKGNNLGIVNFYSFENLQNSLKARNVSSCFLLFFFRSLFLVLKCCYFCLSADIQSEIGDRKLESWTLGSFDHCSFFVWNVVWSWWFLCMFNNMLCSIKKCCMLLLRFWYVLVVFYLYFCGFQLSIEVYIHVH